MSNLLKSKFILGLMMVLAFAVTSTASATITSTLKFGSRGAQVTELQQALGVSPATGYFGNLTKAAVKAWQANNGLTADGVFGAKGRAMLAAGGTTTPPVTGNFPAGCTSTAGFSSVTGLPCSGATSGNFPAGCMSTSGFSTTTGQSCSAPTVVSTGPLAVSLAQDNPASGNVLSNQALADLAHFTFTGTGTLNQVTLQRTGLSVSADLVNVYLFDGNQRLTDGASVNTAGNVVFNNLNIAVSGSKTLSVRVDMASGISTALTSVNLGMSLVSYRVTGSTTANTVSVAGNLFYVSQAPTGGTVVTSTTAGTSLVASGNVNAGAIAYTVWSNSLSVGGRVGILKGLNLHYIGSAPTDALANAKLFLDGTQIGTTSTVSANGYLFFDLGTGVNLGISTHTLDVRADIVKGSNRNFQLSLQNASDLMIIDSQIGININAIDAVLKGTAGTIGVNPGSVTVSVDPAFSTTTTITGGATNVVIGQYKFQAYGEDMKITSLTVTPTISTVTGSPTTMNNVALYANDSQIGSSMTFTTGTPNVYPLGSSLIIPAGTTTIIKVKGDTMTSGSVNYTGGTLKVNLAGSTSNAQGLSSQNLTTAPSTIGVTSTSLAVGAATATVAMNSSLNAQNVISNTAKTKIGSFVIQAGSSEGIRVSNVQIGLTMGAAATTYTSGTLTTAALSTATIVFNNTKNLAIGDTLTFATNTPSAVATVTSITNATDAVLTFVTAGGSTGGTPAVTGQSGPMTITNISNLYTSDDTANVIGNPTLLANTFSANYVIAPSTSKVIDVYADLGGLNAGTVNTTIKVTAFGATTNVTLTGTGSDGINAAKDGQIMTVATGSLAAPTLKTTSMASQFIVGGSTPALATYNFVATNGTAHITELKFTTITTRAAISKVCVGSVCADAIDNGTTTVATVSGLDIVIPAGYSGVDVLVTPTFNLVGVGQQSSNVAVKMTLTNMKYTIGNSTTSPAVNIAANEKVMQLVSTKPTVTVSTPVGAVLSVGSNEGIDITVSADAAGPIVVNSLPITTSLSSGSATIAYFTNAGAVTMKDSSNANVPLTTAACPASATNLTCSQTLTITGGYTIAAGSSQTFKVFLPVANLSTGTLPNTYMYTSLATGAGFSWTDINGASGAITDVTYMNNYPNTVTSSIHN